MSSDLVSPEPGSSWPVSRGLAGTSREPNTPILTVQTRNTAREERITLRKSPVACAVTSSSSDRLKRSWYAYQRAKSCGEPRAQAISTSTRFPVCHFLAASLVSTASCSAGPASTGPWPSGPIKCGVPDQRSGVSNKTWTCQSNLLLSLCS
jgi:hypothetical protein